MPPLECRLSAAAGRRLFRVGLGFLAFWLAALAVNTVINGFDPVIAAGLVLVASLVPAIGYWIMRRAAADRSVKLRVDAQGLFWPAAATLAWPSLNRVVFIRGTKGGVRLNADGLRSATIDLGGLDADPQTIFAAVKAHAPPSLGVVWG